MATSPSLSCVLLLAVLAQLAAPLAAQNPPAGFTYQTVVSGGFSGACTMAFAPDGRLFVLDRRVGQVRVVNQGVLQPQPWLSIGYSTPMGGEAGLLGIAFDPAFATNGYVYLYYTDPSRTQNRIARVREVGGFGTQLTVLSPNQALPTHQFLIHNGGRMVFGLDGKLYVSVGDAENTLTPQALSVWTGKVLRFNAPDLSIPQDNPFPGNAVYALGVRNSFGLAVHPDQGWLFAGENGYLGGDEVNRIVAGGNYGWPVAEGTNPVGSGFVDPVQSIAVQQALTGLSFYSGSFYPGYSGRLFSCQWIDGQVRTLTLSSNGNSLVSSQNFATFVNAYDTAVGPDGLLYVLHTGPNGTMGGSEIGRFVHAAAPNPGLHLMSTSGPSLGGSLTVGVTADNGDLVIAWLGLTAFVPPVPTVAGPIGASIDLQLPVRTVVGDRRTYQAVPLPQNPALVGLSVHAQAVVIDPQTSAIAVTNVASRQLR